MRYVALILALVVILPSSARADDAPQIVKEAIDYLRGSTSYMQAGMLIHREDWERESSFRAWTKGTDYTLVLFTAPAKDEGNASLTAEKNMWSFSPKINRVIKIPPSMRSQSWMGSDFSYRDLSRADDIIKHYSHKLIATESHEGKKLYVIESLPLESAPVVWGKEVVRIREDYITIKHEFFDQDMELVKTLNARDIQMMGGKLYPKYIRMEKAENPEEWTEVSHDEVNFDIEVPDITFTLSNLRNPRR